MQATTARHASLAAGRTGAGWPKRFDRGVLLAAGVSTALWTGLEGATFWRTARAAAVVVATVVASSALRSPRRGVRSLGLLTVGLGATAIGAGIAPPHLAKVGVTAVSVLGLVALGSGAVLLVRGSSLLFHRLRRGPRVLAAIGTFLVVVVLLYLTVPGIAATNVPATSHGRTPGDVGLAAADVSFVTSDGVTLHGWYAPSANGAAIVVRHGSGSTASSTLDHARVLADHGFGVLVVDARGHGSSGGRAMDFGWYGDADIAAAVDFLLDQGGVSSGAVGGLGLSMGGEELVGAAGSDGRLDAIVAEGVTGRTAADHEWFSEEYGTRGWLQEQLSWVQSAFTDLLTDASKPTPLPVAVEEGPPTLLIAAGGVQDEGAVAERLAQLHPSAVRTWTVPGASHTGALATDAAGWATRVVDFFEEHLLD